MRIKRLKKIMTAVLTGLIFCLYTPTYGANITWTVSIGYVPCLPPFLFTDESGNGAGLFIELMNSIARANNFDIIYTPYNNKLELMDAYDNGMCDIALGVIANEYSQHVGEYTTEIAMSYLSMFALKKTAADIEKNIDMNNYIFAYQDKTISSGSRINRGRQAGQKYIIVSDQVNALNMLLSGKADLLIGNSDCIPYLLHQLKRENEVSIVNKNVSTTKYAMLISENNFYLRGIVNQSLQKMYFDGSYEKLQSQWVQDDSKILNRAMVKRVFVIISMIVAIAVFILLIISMINRRLKTEVAEKTKELVHINDELTRNFELIKRNSELRNSIVETNPLGLIVVDCKLNITLINESACELLKTTKESIGKPLYDITLFTSLLEKRRSLEALLELSGCETEITVAENDIRIYKFTVMLQKYDNLELSRDIITIENVTTAIKKKNRIYEEEKNAALNRMLTGIAHEIRNPLTAIKTYIEAIPKNITDTEFIGNLVETVPGEIDRVSSLIKNLMDYSRTNPDKRDAVIVNELVYSCVTLMRHSIEKYGANLTLDIDDGLVIVANKAHFQQIIINLILNSLDSFNNKSGVRQIKVSAVVKEDKVRISVCDNGCGMTPEVLKCASEPFFTTKKGGTGLGLYLTKQYLAQDEGSMTISSEKNSFTNVVLEYAAL